MYPPLVIRGTGLYELWKKGLYRNYEPTQLIDLVARIPPLVPPWVRVYRIQVHPFVMGHACIVLHQKVAQPSLHDVRNLLLLFWVLNFNPQPQCIWWSHAHWIRAFCQYGWSK